MSMPLRHRPPAVNYADDEDDGDYFDQYSEPDPDFNLEEWVDDRSERLSERLESEEEQNYGIRRPAAPAPPVTSLANRRATPAASVSPLSSLSPTPTRSTSPRLARIVPVDSHRTTRLSTRPRSTPRTAPHSLPAVSVSPQSRPLRPFPMLPNLATPPTSIPSLAHRMSNGSTSSDSFEPVEVDPDTGERRFTAREKGKGRAVVRAIEVMDDDPDESIEILAINPGEKRKRAEGDDMGKEDVEVTGAEQGLEERGIGAYMCPVCFSAPEQAVMTDCGHILCAKCLHDSLIAAIRRNPNPYAAHPIVWQPGRPQPARGNARNGPARATRGAPRGRRAEPVEWNWTADSLKSAWSEVQIKRYEDKLVKEGVERENWQLIKENDAAYPMEERLVVKEELKGLWSIDGKDWVIEGECPVCRKQIPGGYAPPTSGLGGVIPLYIRVESGR